jgi:hypothetical protein
VAAVIWVKHTPGAPLFCIGVNDAGFTVIAGWREGSLCAWSLGGGLNLGRGGRCADPARLLNAPVKAGGQAGVANPSERDLCVRLWE